MPEIIGLCGVIGSGKDHQAKLLVAKGFVQIDMKDALIDMCEDIVGYSIRENYEDFKTHIVGFEKRLSSSKIQNLNSKQFKEFSEGCINESPYAMTGRRLLQRVGTEAMRKRNPDYWVNAWSKKCKEYILAGKSVVSADVRFENEMRAIILGGKSLEVPAKIFFNDYYSDRYDAKSKHESEALAQRLLAIGMQDGDEITLDLIEGLK